MLIKFIILNAESVQLSSRLTMSLGFYLICIRSELCCSAGFIGSCLCEFVIGFYIEVGGEGKC